MRVTGDNAPLNAFSVEEQPKHPGYFLIRFYENIQPYSSDKGDTSTNGYEYDEYYLEIENRQDLTSYIQAHFDELFAEAKLAGTDTRTAQEKRTWAYANELSVVYDGEAITINAASELLAEYEAEGATESYKELQTLISAAKEKIRTTYPDEMEA